MSEHQREDARLETQIQQIDLLHRKVYGSQRIHVVLKARGVGCSRKRWVRLVQQLGISALVNRSRKPTTKNNPRARFAPKRLNHEFLAEVPKSKWVTDTKVVENGEGWLYLAVMRDLFSSMVVG